jgi:hypothetical protein
VTGSCLLRVYIPLPQYHAAAHGVRLQGARGRPHLSEDHQLAGVRGLSARPRYERRVRHPEERLSGDLRLAPATLSLTKSFTPPEGTPIVQNGEGVSGRRAGLSDPNLANKVPCVPPCSDSQSAGGRDHRGCTPRTLFAKSGSESPALLPETPSPFCTIGVPSGGVKLFVNYGDERKRLRAPPYPRRINTRVPEGNWDTKSEIAW